MSDDRAYDARLIETEADAEEVAQHMLDASEARHQSEVRRRLKEALRAAGDRPLSEPLEIDLPPTDTIFVAHWQDCDCQECQAIRAEEGLSKN